MAAGFLCRSGTVIDSQLVKGTTNVSGALHYPGGFMFIIPAFYLPALMYSAWIDALTTGTKAKTAYNEWAV